MGELMGGAIGVALNSHRGVPHFISGDELHDQFGPLASDYHRWLRSIKKSFDPEGLSDATYHITVKLPD